LARVTRANAPSGHYTMPAQGTVLDTKTKLTWQQAVSTSTYSWGSRGTSGTAQFYCASLSLNGGGWRMPTIGELVTLVDYSQTGGNVAMIDSTYFPGTPAAAFWASTPVSGATGLAWIVYFNNGNTNASATSAANYVRCVR
jgi:hypothetical protein